MGQLEFKERERLRRIPAQPQRQQAGKNVRDVKILVEAIEMLLCTLVVWPSRCEEEIWKTWTPTA